jgi:hypothetical protein
VPDGVQPGQLLYVTTPKGNEIEVEVPEGVGPGDLVEVFIGEIDSKQSSLVAEIENKVDCDSSFAMLIQHEMEALLEVDMDSEEEEHPDPEPKLEPELDEVQHQEDCGSIVVPSRLLRVRAFL